MRRAKGRLAKKPDNLADFEADDAGGALGGLLAEENELDGRTLWRIASWGVGATGAVVLAVMANQSSIGIKRDHVAAADLTRQTQQIQVFARDTQNEARRLAGHRVQHLRERRSHARALAGRKYDSQAGSIGHSGPRSLIASR